MSEHHPRIRVLAKNGHVLIREGLCACFHMRRPHSEAAPGVLRSLDTYRRAVGAHALSWYADADAEWQRLDASGWEYTYRNMVEEPWGSLYLTADSGSEARFRIEYLGRELKLPSLAHTPEETCVVSFWLPTEFLEQGPQVVREFLLELAAPLPFNSGNAGLAFNCQLDLAGVAREVRQYCFRYPGMDVLLPSITSMRIGTRVRSPSWLTFLGQPVLGELGGVSGLRSRLHTPGTTVQELEGDRAVVTLGPWPEAGDTEQGKDLPAYRELARVLEPWTLWGEGEYVLGMNPDDARRWERRFLD
ncbi:DUF3396 domain-containing protein [Pyxidicoccus trucidator]|uniref:DUF3396 domain-containing protein n=1 Tax=Pyxidicoccus trucidator TaxID=2709662 RepID=UPI0019672811|nr:DUF3396 domain-containing protein [Pyxidicoccus trucidator]